QSADHVGSTDVVGAARSVVEVQSDAVEDVAADSRGGVGSRIIPAVTALERVVVEAGAVALADQLIADLGAGDEHLAAVAEISRDQGLGGAGEGGPGGRAVAVAGHRVFAAVPDDRGVAG